MNRKQRRASQAIVDRDPALKRAQSLSVRAHRILSANLSGFGNVLSETHREALMRVVGGMAMLATGAWRRSYPHSSERVAYPLDTGLGKTESVVALLAAIHQLGLPLSVAVATSKVEDLASMYRRLMDNGVPAEMIAVWHSKEYDLEKLEAIRAGDTRVTRKYASVRASADEELHSRPFLLCSHERIRRGGDVTFNGRKRSLVVWDEALLVSSSRAINLDELRGVVAYLSEQKAAREEGSALQAALGWLSAAKAALTAEQERQEREPGSPAQLLYLPSVVGTERWLGVIEEEREEREPAPSPLDLPSVVTPEAIDEWLDAIDDEGRKPRAPGMDAAKHLLENGPATPVRVLHALKERAMVSFEVTIPEDLRPIAVLDASYPIKELEKLDKGIECDPSFAQPKGQFAKIKRYSRVTGHVWRTKSGRGALERALDPRTPGAASPIIDEVVKLVTKKIPPTEAVLFFTHLPKRRVNVAETLKEALALAGVDLGAKLADGRPRFGWLTFGSETSANAFSKTENVVFVGAFFRGDADVAAAIAGQKGDLTGELDSDEITRVIRSETAHSLYQGLSRGACRVVEDGEAKPMRFWLTLSGNHAGPIQKLLDDRMPDLQWTDWVSQPTKESEAAKAIGDYLDGLPAEVTRVSSREVKRGAGLTKLVNDTFQRARDAALKGRPGWQLDGRSVVRCA